MTSNWSRAALLFWALIFVVLLGYELWCVFGHDSETPPLTLVVVNYVPWPVTMAILFWLVMHFTEYYVKLKGAKF